MVVSANQQFGTIGGGNLEYIVIEQARKMIQQSDDGFVFQDYPLGPLLGQCCGGHVRLLLETIDRSSVDWLQKLKILTGERRAIAIHSTIRGKRLDKHVCPQSELASWQNLGSAVSGDPSFEGQYAVTLLDQEGQPIEGRVKPMQDGAHIIETLAPASLHITMFGAGHVGQAMSRVLGALECPVTWIDSRSHIFPQNVPSNIETIVASAPAAHVKTAPPSSAYYVFTHSHELDLEITVEILIRGDFLYCGLIGSKTKRLRFEHRLKERGIEASVIRRLTCPIGGAALGGKSPELIAIAAVAELLSLKGSAT